MRAHCRTAPLASRPAVSPPVLVAGQLPRLSALQRLWPVASRHGPPSGACLAAPPPASARPPPTPTLPTRGSRRRPAAGLGLVYIVGQWTASAGCGVQRRARSTVYRLPGPPTRRSQRGWGASASAGGLAGPGRPSGLDSGAALRWGADPWGLVVAQHPPRCSVPLRWFLKCMCAGALAG